MPRKPEPREMVWHPRYGDTTIPSDSGLSEKEVRASFYGYLRATLFPASAIPANIERQNYSTMPRGCYVDLLKTCVDCDRDFIFFALEQRHWYEVLRFYVDADCIRCPGCRKSNQQLHRRFKRYSEAIARDSVSDEELATLVDDAAFLWTSGILRNEQRLRQLRNLARRRIPSTKATKKVEKIVADIKTVPPARRARF
jgi:Probable zinc-ribbon domain